MAASMETTPMQATQPGQSKARVLALDAIAVLSLAAATGIGTACALAGLTLFLASRGLL